MLLVFAISLVVALHIDRVDTYKFQSFGKLPIDPGIDPVSWLAYSCLCMLLIALQVLFAVNVLVLVQLHRQYEVQDRS
jgi:hypothetical protein